MKPFLALLLTLCLTNCKENSISKNLDDKVIAAVEEKAMHFIDRVEVPKNQLVLDQNKGVWSYKSQPFTGYSVKFYPNNKLQEKVGFFNGKKDGVTRRWSKNGVLRFESNYNQNKLVGTYKSWWENGELSAESNYVKGVMQGVEKKWYSTGQIAKLRHIVDGKESGMQQAWLKNGKLYVNYEAKNGRVFGLKRANLCYKLEDEKVIRNKK